MAEGSVAIRTGKAQAQLGAERPFDPLWDGEDTLKLCASYIERTMGNLKVCAAALRHKEGADEEIRLAIASMLGDEAHNDLDVAREILQKWETAEVAAHASR
jgi:hypothetical protein